MNLLTFSNKLARFKSTVDGFSRLHAYRYGHFANSSPKGEMCKYAQLTKMEFQNERGDLLGLLLGLRQELDQMIETLTSNEGT